MLYPLVFFFVSSSFRVYWIEQVSNGILQTSSQWSVYEKGSCASGKTISTQL